MDNSDNSGDDQAPTGQTPADLRNSLHGTSRTPPLPRRVLPNTTPPTSEPIGAGRSQPTTNPALFGLDMPRRVPLIWRPNTIPPTSLPIDVVRSYLTTNPALFRLDMSRRVPLIWRPNTMPPTSFSMDAGRSQLTTNPALFGILRVPTMPPEIVLTRASQPTVAVPLREFFTMPSASLPIHPIIRLINPAGTSQLNVHTTTALLDNMPRHQLPIERLPPAAIVAYRYMPHYQHPSNTLPPTDNSHVTTLSDAIQRAARDGVSDEDFDLILAWLNEMSLTGDPN